MSRHKPAFDIMMQMAEAARAVSLAHYAQVHDGTAKADRSLVTAADLAVEETVRAAARTAGFGVVGEEGGDENAGAEYVVVVDPIDGTNHFIVQDDQFFTLLALHHRDDGFVGGICDQPATPHLWHGLRGAGAFHRNKATAIEKPLRAAPASLSQSILTSFNPDSLLPADRGFFADIAGVARAVVPGGDAGNYARLAAGRVQLVLERVGGLYDVAAFVPILAEAGAAIAWLDDDGMPHALTLDTRGSMTVLAAASSGMIDDLAARRRAQDARYRKYAGMIGEFLASGVQRT